MTQSSPQYLFAADSKPSLPVFNVPIVEATDAALDGYGYLVDDPDSVEVEIVTWPAQGWRPVDADTGNEGGVVEGVFHGEWRGDTLMGVNDAVSGHYVLGWSTDPKQASDTEQTVAREQVLLWHLNYHPDGGQLFFPLDNQPYLVPLALPGDDLTPNKVVGFRCGGGRGLYIHPNIWHEGIFPVADNQRFLDRQGAVHARVSCDLGTEFGVYLSVSLAAP